MSYTTWQDLVEEDEEPPDRKPLDPADIADKVPGLSNLLKERKELERQMKGLVGGDPDEDLDERDKARFPKLTHTAESRMLDRRMYRMDVEKRMGELKKLSERRMAVDKEEETEQERRQRLMKRAADRKRARLLKAAADGKKRGERQKALIQEKWRAGKEFASKAKAVRSKMEQGRNDDLDLRRLDKVAQNLRDRYIQSVREGGEPVRPKMPLEGKTGAPVDKSRAAKRPELPWDRLRDNAMGKKKKKRSEDADWAKKRDAMSAAFRKGMDVGGVGGVGGTGGMDIGSIGKAVGGALGGGGKGGGKGAGPMDMGLGGGDNGFDMGKLTNMDFGGMGKSKDNDEAAWEARREQRREERQDDRRSKRKRR